MAINPLQPPINYMGSQINLSEQFSGLGEALQQRQARNLLEDQQKQYITDFTATINEPSQKGFANLLAKHGRSPAIVSSIESARKQFGEERIKNDFNQGFQISNALENNNPEVATKLLQEIITAKTNSKEPLGLYGQVSKFLEDGNTKAAQGTLNLALSNIDPDQFTKIVNARTTAEGAPSALTKKIAEADKAVAEAVKAQAQAKNAFESEDADKRLKIANANKSEVEAKFKEETILAELDKSKWDTNNLKSQVSERNALFGGKKQLQNLEIQEKIQNIAKVATDIPASGQKLINEFVVDSVNLRNSSTNALDLANKIETMGGGIGKLTSFSETIKTATGNQGAFTELRNEYTRLRNKIAIKNLPPGVATDKDVTMALQGIPPETANAATIASFLRGTAKLQQYEAATKDAQTEWVSSVGSLANARNDIQIGDTLVPRGTTYVDFQDRFMKRNAEELAKKQAIETIPSRGYMKYGKPQ
jgi:hypothetical protein